MNRSMFAVAASCAVVGAAVASVLVPAGAEQVGGNDGTVTIHTPISYTDTATTRLVVPRIDSAGNIELGTPTLTLKKGSKTIVSEGGRIEGVKPGTYTATTKAKYRYVTFRQQNVPVVPNGVRLENIRGYTDEAGTDDHRVELVRTTCTITSLNPSAGTFVASCALSYSRTTVDQPSGEYTITPVALGTMPLTGTYEGTSGVQDGHPDAILAVDPHIGGRIYAQDDENVDPQVDSSLYATKSFDLSFFNRKAGAFHYKSKTITLTIK